MANYAYAKEIIAANVYTNHDGQVTAEKAKTAINEVVDTLIAGGYLYAGVAKLTPTQTNPGSPDANVFYIATEPGTYTNFVGAGGSLVVADGEVAIFKYNGQWSKETTGAATAASVTELGQEVSGTFPGGVPESLSIVDEDDNAILRLDSYTSVDEDGNLKTRNFDSSEIKAVPDEDDGLSFEDYAGNTILKVDKDGIIRTKSFNSAKGAFIVVDAQGRGDYTSLEEAIANAGDSYEQNISKTIIVLPGTYIMNTPADDSNRTSFGARSLNIIGTDREKCIVKGTVGYYAHSGTAGVTEPRDYAPLKLAGNCYIANLTIISTDDDFQMPGDDSGNPEERHRSYCIHFDYNCPGAWTGHVDNCVLINDHQTCIGCGIRGKILVTNCILESTIYDPAQRAVMGCIAAHETPGDYEAELFVKDSILTGKNCPCVLLSNVYGNPIHATFVNNVAFNDAGGGVLIMNSTYHDKTKYCFGNNSAELNY